MIFESPYGNCSVNSRTDRPLGLNHLHAPGPTTPVHGRRRRRGQSHSRGVRTSEARAVNLTTQAAIAGHAFAQEVATADARNEI